MVADLLSEIPREDLEGKLLISICAGLTIGQIKKWVPESTVVVRAMPNTPAKVRIITAELLRARPFAFPGRRLFASLPS